LSLQGGIAIADAVRVLEENGIAVTQRPDDLYILASGTELQCVRLQAVVSRQMLLWLAETFHVPIERFYQMRSKLN
jgi:hypothetical protein